MLCDTMPASNFVSFISVKQETWAVISRGFYQRIGDSYLQYDA